MRDKWHKGNLYKLSIGSSGAKIVVDWLEAKSRNELNFDIIKSFLGMIVAEWEENKTKLLSEHNDETLTIGNGILGVIKTLSKGKIDDFFPERILEEAMLVPFAAINFVPMGAREEIGSIRKEEEGAVWTADPESSKAKGKKKMMRVIPQKSRKGPHQVISELSSPQRPFLSMEAWN